MKGGVVASFEDLINSDLQRRNDFSGDFLSTRRQDSIPEFRKAVDQSILAGGPPTTSEALTKARSVDIFNSNSPSKTFSTKTASSTFSKEITPTQYVGLQAASSALEAVSALQNIKENEKLEIRKINDNFRNYEFTHRLNRSAAMVSETRQILANISSLIKGPRPQISGQQTQILDQRSPSSGAFF